MVFFDTNVLIYAFCKNIDNNEQQDISLKLFDKAIKNQNIVLSELILCEFAFISNKLKEDASDIGDNLKFLSTFLKQSNININQRMTEILKETNLYMSSFDVYHLAFAEYYNTKLFTFDKGFKKLQKIAKIEIEIK
jgi:predicted nucleic acid-binding protein